MKFKALNIFVIAITTTGFLHSVSAQKTITGFEAPESAITSGGKIFVSNIGGTQPNPMALDSNGFISELAADGKIIGKKFNKATLNGPKGFGHYWQHIVYCRYKSCSWL